ncbi:MAG: hypothetical protein ABIH34_04530 [Nanoarchaeota archaeon]
MKHLFDVFGNMSRALEVFTMLQGLKESSRLIMPESSLAAVSTFCRNQNLPFNLSERVAQEGTGFIAKGTLGKGDHRIVFISRDQMHLNELKTAEISNDHEAMGALLGFPSCCISFFQKHHVQEEKAAYDFLSPLLDNTTKRHFPFTMNIFGRYFDAPLLSHAPCSLECAQSRKLADKRYSALEEKHPIVADQLHKLLSTAVIMSDAIIMLHFPEGKGSISFLDVLSSRSSSLADRLQKEKQLTHLGKDYFSVGKSRFHTPLFFFNT